MTESEVARADAILRRHGIRFVVVGGQAIVREAATSTRDVDVMVATADYDTTLKLLRRDQELAFDWEDDHVARFRILPIGGVPLDVINAATFSGVTSGEAFFRYLTEEASSEAGGIAYATPEVVWYTRLLTKRWKAYAEKIVTNVIDGVPSDRLRKVERIAARFGTGATLEPRIAYVRAELERPDIRSLVRPQ